MAAGHDPARAGRRPPAYPHRRRRRSPRSAAVVATGTRRRAARPWRGSRPARRRSRPGGDGDDLPRGSLHRRPRCSPATSSRCSSTAARGATDGPTTTARGDGRVTPCQQERYADPAASRPWSAPSTDVAPQGARRTSPAVQYAELSRTTRSSKRAWRRGGAAGTPAAHDHRMQLIGTHAVAGVGDEAHAVPRCAAGSSPPRRTSSGWPAPARSSRSPRPGSSATRRRT